MRIFVSYAREHHAVADRIAVGLTQEGHEVFFDRDDLAPGSAYDARIRDEIGRMHLLLFLVSPESVREEAYALSELSVARKRWSNPDGRVLPVFVAQTDIDDVPGYLRSVGILQTEGDLVADVLAAVAGMASRRRRRVRNGLVAGVATVATAAGLLLYAFWPRPPAPPLSAVCALQSQIRFESATHASDLSLVAHVAAGGGTNSFGLSPDGAGAIDVSPPRDAAWSIEIVDADGVSLGTVELNGCPDVPTESELREGVVLILRPR